METIKLETASKTFIKVVATATTEKVKDLRNQVRVILGAEIKESFKEVKLSPRMKDYCKTLLTANLVKSLQKDFINEQMGGYVDVGMDVDTRVALRGYFTHVAGVATFAVRQEIRRTEKDVEKHVLSRLAEGDYKLLGTDFTSVQKELRLALHSKGGNPMKEFNALMVALYATSLSNKKVKEVKDAVVRNFNEALREGSVMSYESVETPDRVAFIEAAGKKVNMKRLEEQFLSVENKSYVVKPRDLMVKGLL